MKSLPLSRIDEMSGLFGTEVSREYKKSVEWYTPKWIFDRLGIMFDLDPCSPIDFETMVPAEKKLTIIDNGLSVEWSGRVWMNPPYGKETKIWMDKFIDHGNGICLVFSRTDSKWFQKALKKCDAVLFVSGRINFIPGEENKHKKSRCGAGSALFAIGKSNVDALKKLNDIGVLFTGCR